MTLKIPQRTGDISFDYNLTLDCLILNLESGFSDRILLRAGFTQRDINTAKEIIELRGGLGDDYYSEI